MVKALEIVIEKVRKLPAERQEEVAQLFEDVLAANAGAGAGQPPDRVLGVLEGELDITGDIVNSSGFWDESESIKEWLELDSKPDLSAAPAKPRLRRAKR